VSTPWVGLNSDCDVETRANNKEMLCKPCQGLGPLVQIWLYLCPAFPFTVFLLSSGLPRHHTSCAVGHDDAQFSTKPWVEMGISKEGDSR
jgi:hypothetical protein